MTTLDRVVVVNDDGGRSGGAASVALASARLIRGRGIPVTYLTGDEGENAELKDAGVDVVSLGGKHIMQGSRAVAGLRGIFDPGTAARLRDWCDRNDSPGTVYNLHNWHKVLSPSVLPVLKQAGARLFLTAHDYFLVCPNGAYFQYPNQEPCELIPLSLQCLKTACDRRSYSHKLWRVSRQVARETIFPLRTTSATFIAVHEQMVPLLELGGIRRNRVRVLRNPITPWRTTRIRAELNQEVFFIGRLEADKGIDLLAGAARKANLPLRVIGDGPLRATLERSYPEVRFDGWRSGEEVAELVGKARFVVVPTRWRETFGLVAIEALMSGLPVVISRFALISDEVVERGMGLSCDPYDEEALAAALTCLASDDGKVQAMSLRAFTSARALAPTPDEWCDNLIALYENAVHHPPCRVGMPRGSPAYRH